MEAGHYTRLNQIKLCSPTYTGRRNLMFGNKVDLVMWTKNGESCLPKVLSQIDKVIPSENVCHKIMIDDHSTDRTVEIARNFNWAVYPNPRGGIPSGANEAFRRVDQDFFISFEQDVILANDWWEKIPKYLEDPSVGCAQGIRVPSHPLLFLLDRWEFGEENEKARQEISMDNNIFRTKVVKMLGGFPKICPVCTDTVLKVRMISETPYKWITDPAVISLHMRTDLRSSIEHGYKLRQICAKTSYCSRGKKYSQLGLFRLLLTSPIRALQIAILKNCPDMIWAYPYLRLSHLLVDIKWKPEPY